MTYTDQAALFTVLLPVHRPPALLPFAIESVLAQREKRFRLCIVCDGAPPETAACAREFAARDARVEVFAFEKGERLGEAHRHQVLRDANSEFVAQIGDDDLWFPDYLDELAALLAHVDFGNLPQTDLTTEGHAEIIAEDLGHPTVRRTMLEEKWNMVGPTFVGYRLSAYRQLPEGWSPAPPDIWTDLFMWRKFLAMPGGRFATRFSVQGAKLHSGTRQAWTLAERAAETADFANRMRDPLARSRFQIKALEQLAVGQRRLNGALSAHETQLVVARAALQRELDEMHAAKEVAEVARAGLLRELTAQAGVSLRLSEIEDQNARSNAEASELRHRLALVHQSTSWRVTGPFRFTKRAVLLVWHLAGAFCRAAAFSRD